MEKKFENRRKIISIGSVLIAIIMIIVMFASILVKGNSVNDETNNALEDNKNYTDYTDTINYITNLDGSRENCSKQVKKEQKVKGFVISNTKIVFQNGISNITMDILNKEEDINNLRIKIMFIENDSEIILEKEIEIGDIIENETKNINFELQDDLSNIKSVRYEIVE